jgi:uncharacterized protein YegP (UPF0339 family)
VNEVARFEVLLSPQNGQFYWHLLADNGQPIAWSGETYVRKIDCVNMLNAIRQNAARIPVIDLAA